MVSAPDRWVSPACPFTVIGAAPGKRWPLTGSAGLAKVPYTVTAQVERGEAGLKDGSQHRHVHQLLDDIALFGGRFKRFIPVGGVIGPLTHPGESEQFGLLVVSQILERGNQLFLDAGIDRIVEDRQCFTASFVIDVLGGLAPVIICRNLCLIFLRAEDDAAKRVERCQRFHRVTGLLFLAFERGEVWRVPPLVDAYMVATYRPATRPSGKAFRGGVAQLVRAAES